MTTITTGIMFALWGGLCYLLGRRKRDPAIVISRGYDAADLEAEREAGITAGRQAMLDEIREARSVAGKKAAETRKANGQLAAIVRATYAKDDNGPVEDWPARESIGVSMEAAP